MSSTIRAAFVTLLLALIPLATSASAAEPPAYRLIVHPKNPATSLDRIFLQDAFLKKQTRWPTGESIRPVDQSTSSGARKAFTRDVLGRSVSAVQAYWQQKIFSGRDVPPLEVYADDRVVAYVLAHDGAVGYVSGSAEVGAARIVGVTR
jgi:ABC-type phosphate transport system substrate-binding protein